MTENHTPEKIRDNIVQSLEDNKAEDIITIDLAGKSTLADYMVIATGRSSRHVVGLSSHIADSLAKESLSKINFDGKDTGDWVLGDAGDVIVHLFRAEVRDFYNIEKIWCDPEFLEKYESQKQNAPALASE